MDDRQLQETYEGLFPKLRVIKDLFFNDEARDILYKTLRSTTRTFGRPVQMPTVPLKLYTDLQVEYRHLALCAVLYVPCACDYSDATCFSIYPFRRTPCCRNTTLTRTTSSRAPRWRSPT